MYILCTLAVAARVVSKSPLKYKTYTLTVVPAPGNVVQISGVGANTAGLDLLLENKKCGYVRAKKLTGCQQTDTVYAVMHTDHGWCMYLIVVCLFARF